eukprot:Mrub_11031.p2 GENE.Mrub_11031~~Mrub_11031.p2  ORF type:complete len:188 (+),score=47.04 Mrub_11031:42-566(+)
MIDKAFMKASKGEKTLDIKEVPDVLRYLNIFPSHYDISDEILQKMAKDSYTIEIEEFRNTTFGFIEHMKYQPADSNTLMVSFQQLDENHEGCINIDVLKRHLTDKDTEPFQEGTEEREDGDTGETRRYEWNTFLKHITYNKWLRDNKFYYEEYIYALSKENEEHMNKLIEDWTF